jgi:hypothetical protein
VKHTDSVYECTPENDTPQEGAGNIATFLLSKLGKKEILYLDKNVELKRKLPLKYLNAVYHTYTKTTNRYYSWYHNNNTAIHPALFISF